MQAWVGALGKPLTCLIAGADGLAGYRFSTDDSRGERLSAVELFPPGAIVSVD